MTEYEALQEQRNIERNIRKWKREQVAMEAVGQSIDDTAVKLKAWQAREDDFLKQTGLKKASDRTSVGGYGKSQATKVTNAAKRVANAQINAPDISDLQMQTAKESFKEILENAPSTNHVKRMVLYEEITEWELNEKLKSPFAYIVDKDVIQYNPTANNFELYDLNFAQAHELSHRMDILEYQSYNNQKFISAIESSKAIVQENVSQITEWFEAGGKYRKSEAFSDIISGLSDNAIEVPVGHESDYWSQKNTVELEVFANISSMDILNDSAMADFKKMFGQLYEAYEGVIK